MSTFNGVEQLELNSRKGEEDARELTDVDSKSLNNSGRFEKKDDLKGKGELEQISEPVEQPKSSSGIRQVKYRKDNLGGKYGKDSSGCKVGPPSKKTELDRRVAGAAPPGSLFRDFKTGLETLHKFYKSELVIFMAYTTLSAFVGGVLGALVTVYAPRYINLDSSKAVSTSVTTTTATSQVSTSPPQTPIDFQRKIDEIKNTLDQCLAEHLADQEVITNLKGHVGSLNSSLDNLNNDLSSMRTETESNYTLLTQNVTLRNFVVESQITELRNVFVSKEWLFIILLMGLFEVAVIGVVWVMWQKLTETLRQKIRARSAGAQVTNNVANGRPLNTGGGGIQGDSRVLDQVKHCMLENRVCVISFHSETINSHIAQVKAVLSQNEAAKHVPIVQFLIGSHDDILQVPPSKLYLVFVDFNERNVILEDPNKGLGDLRLTTVQAVDRMGADAILTYSRDTGSSSLTSGDLYNPDLSSVRHHPELRRLDNQKRMLSVFDKFNKEQTEHIVKIVKDMVKR